MAKGETRDAWVHRGSRVGWWRQEGRTIHATVCERIHVTDPTDVSGQINGVAKRNYALLKVLDAFREPLSTKGGVGEGICKFDRSTGKFSDDIEDFRG